MKRIAWHGLLLLSLAHAAGCARSAAPGETPKSYERLRAVTTAYVQFLEERGQAPANADDLMPLLKAHGNPTELLRSDHDDEPFVIHWSVDHRTYAQAHKPYPVIAYEKSPNKGKRYVGFPTNVLEMTDEEFREAPFPTGHKPPP